MDKDLDAVAKILKNNGVHQENNYMAEHIAQQIKEARIEAVGWTWAEACTDTDNGYDIRKRLVPTLIDGAQRDLVDNRLSNPGIEHSQPLSEDKTVEDCREKFSNTENCSATPNPATGEN